MKDAVTQIENAQTRPSTSRRHKVKPPATDSSKIERAVGKAEADVDDIEIIPKRVPDLPYESDVLPRGGLTFEALKKENLFRGYYHHYYDPIDENGISLEEQKLKQQIRAAFHEGELKVEEAMESLDWSVQDVPATARAKVAKVERKAPGTASSRKAAAALSMPAATSAVRGECKPKQAASAAARTKNVAPKTVLPIQRPSRMDSAISIAASRTAVGYTRGRTMMKSAKSMQKDSMLAAEVVDKPFTGRRGLP